MKARIIYISVICLLIVRVSFGQDDNHVKSMTAREPILGSLSIVNDKDKVSESVQYVDGLGRASQQVTRYGAPDGKDIITPIVYDAYGRQIKTYLPYKSSVNTGAYANNAVNGQITYYTGKYGTNDQNHAFSEQLLEPSPRNRVEATAAPGYAWRMSAGKTVGSQYWTNTTEVVAVLSGEVGAFARNGNYSSGKLRITETSDENNTGLTREVTDMQGRVIRKDVKLSASEWASTYYIYDMLSNLTAVIQPEGVKRILAGTNSWADINSQSFQDNYMFMYKYDLQNRMVEKKVPGSDWIYMVYDARDRLVLTQSGADRSVVGLTPGQVKISTNKNLPAYDGNSYVIAGGSGASVTLKDGFTFTATPGNSFSVKSEQAARWIATKYDHLNRPVMTGEVYYYENRDQLQAIADGITDFVEEYTGSGTLEGYNGSGFPSVMSQSDLLTVTYYDSYGFTSESAPSGAMSTAKGQVTGGKVRDLQSGNMIENVTFYDRKYRPLKTVAGHHKSGKDIVTSTYRNEISPDLTKTVREHTSSGYSGTLTVTDEFAYDHMSRLLTHKQKLNSGALKTLVANTYNDLGELTKKKLHNGAAQTVDYTYNMRGWLTKINGGTSLGTGDKFGMELQYNAAGQYNGNIGKIRWKSNGSNTAIQEYNYSYDLASRLTGATYVSSGKNGHFNLSGVTYDANGNIETLSRYHGGVYLDQLNYDYAGNRLTSVGDAKNDTDDKAFTELSNGNVANEYTYDANGNMTSDANKGIGDITYNYLNLPEMVTFDNGNKVQYTYDAAGMKLSKQTTIGASVTTTDYIGGIQYTNNALDFIQHAEGRVEITSSNPGISWTFNSTTDGFGSVNDISGFGVSSGRLVGTITDNDPYIYGPDNINVAASTYSVVRVRLKNNTNATQAQIFFTTTTSTGFDGAKRLDFDIEPLSGFVDYYVDFSNHSSWSGTIKRIRLDPSVGVSTGSFEVDDIQIVTRSPFAYKYNLTDHLGNVRVTVDHQGNVEQADDYYPFGLTFNAGGSDRQNDYLYNGKELQGTTGWLHYGSRFYDPAISRWLQLDPASDLMHEWSLYNYNYNDPINYIDPDGAIPWPIKKFFNGFARKLKPDDYFGNPRKGQGYPADYRHAGVDLNFKGGKNTDKGAPVLATHTGKIIEVRKYSDHDNSAGTYVKIQSADGSIRTVYMHLDEVVVNEGDEVEEGQQIGTLGGSGFGSRDRHVAHLHYEIRERKSEGVYEPINPQDEDGNMIDPQKMIDDPIVNTMKNAFDAADKGDWSTFYELIEEYQNLKDEKDRSED